MSDFERVAAGLRGGRVGAPWAGVAGPQIVFPPPRVGGAAAEVPAQSPSVFYTQGQPMYGGNSYFSLTKQDPALNLVPANDSRVFKRIPERRFHPLQFMAVSWIQDLLVVQISMSNKNFMSHDQESGMPITLLSEVSQAMGINWADINTSNGCTTTIFNQTALPLAFMAGFAGIQLDEE
jgi:hypothetical protein